MADVKVKKNKISKRSNNRNGYLFIAPYGLAFTVFILVPVLLAVALSFTNFNAIEFPSWVGFLNYITVLTNDEVFMQHVLPNTVVYALIVGVGGYILSFILAWALCNLTRGFRTVFALILYSPSMTAGVAMTVVWKVIFSGDQTGLLNSWLMSLGVLNEPVIWLINANYLLPIVIIIGLWSSMGIGFLSLIAGILNTDESLYEAGAIDGIKNRFQEMIYVTIPSMKPQMLFAAVMQIVSSFTAGDVGRFLTSFPSTDYAAHTIMTHAFDYGFIRYEMGYASAICFVLFAVMLLANWAIKKILGKYLD